MIRQGIFLASLAVLASAGVPRPAAAAADKQAVAGRVGVLGVGVEYTRALSPRLALRAGLNGSQAGFDQTKSGIAYAFDAVWSSLSVGVDFHPLKGPLRVSAGVLDNGNELRATSRSAGDVTVGDHTYTPQEIGTLTARASFRSAAPFVSVGWDWSRKRLRHFGMSLDVGLLSEGKPRVTLKADGGMVSDPTFQSDIATERQQLQDSLSNLDVLPFLTVGFVFRF